MVWVDMSGWDVFQGSLSVCANQLGRSLEACVR